MRKCKVGVLMNRYYQHHTQIATALGKTLNAEGEFSVTHLHVEMNQEAVRDKVQRLAYREDPFDVLVPIGLRCSVLLKNVLDEIGGYPTLFVGVRDPVAVGLIDSLDAPGGNVSAVVRSSAADLAVAEKIALIRPHIKKVILPYWSFTAADHMSKQVEVITSYFRENGIPLVAREVVSATETLTFIKEEVTSGDVVMLLEGGPSDMYAEVSYLCWDRGALWCADGLESLGKGAACVYGGDLHRFGEGAKQVLTQFWQGRRMLGTIPATELADDRQFVANAAMIQMIGLSSEVISIFKDVENIALVRCWPSNPLTEGVLYG